MKNKTLLPITVLIVLIIVCIIQSTKKKDIYITFPDIKNYQYHFVDSTNIMNTSKIIISHTGELSHMSYQWWEIEIDSKGIQKTDLETIGKIITCSQYFIINNYGGIKVCDDELNKYRFNVIKWVNDEPFILPVKKIYFVIE